MSTQRIGILVCDEVSAPLNQYGQYVDMFARLLRSTGRGVECIAYHVCAAQLPRSVDSCDAYIITGSRRSVYEDLPWIAALSEFLRALHAARRPTAGICFGHQLIGQTFGGRTERATQGWGLGRQVAQVVASADWMQPAASNYALYGVHQDQVTALPPGARRLATSSHCENAMFVLDGVLLGVQGHPEFERDYARAITINKQGIAPEEVIARALPSFEQAVDADLVARWLMGFLCGPDTASGKAAHGA